MPERTVLFCDAPGCDEVGDRFIITMGTAPPVEVIVGPNHRANSTLDEIMGWGKPARARRRRVEGHRRDTDRRSLQALLPPGVATCT